jgi:hypothetical protein
MVINNLIMKKLIPLLLIAIIAVPACETDLDKLPDGSYTGTFQRQSPSGSGEIANVTITFSSNSWTGQSDKDKYPALCHGTYKLDNTKIIFTNDCPWTAEFDWSLILSGEYTFELRGEHLEIIRDFSGQTNYIWTDIYTLTNQNK